MNTVVYLIDIPNSIQNMLTDYGIEVSLKRKTFCQVDRLQR